jgi:hypothetical protein
MEFVMRCDCLCGQVEFEIVGDIPNLYQCHCSLCRKQGGSSSNTATIIARENFRWLSGHEHISSWVKNNGFRSDFCSKCGTPVPNPLGGAPFYWVPAGLLGEEVKSSIVAHLFVGSKASWDGISQPGKQFETMPSLSEIIEFLQSDGHV